MKHRGNAGNTHAVANYLRVAPKYGHSAALYGEPLSYLSELKFSTDIREFDRVVYLFESELYRVKTLQEVSLLGNIPKQHRLIMYMDGMYNPVIHLDQYDFNHRSEAERARWVEFYDTLANKAGKRGIAPSDHSRVT